MMSNNIASKPPPTKEENQPGGGGGGRKPSSQRPPEQTLRCPRCDSTNTKFCYYNNYNLTQPRYFCKTCRRYWTKGGALRNIPIGGGCRKNKKTKSCTSKFIIGDSTPANGVDFQLGGINYPHRVVNQLASGSYGQNSQNNLPFMNLDPLGFGYPKGDFQEMGFTNNNLLHNTSLTSSIESLSSLNQDLHWKLQQQRLAVLFGGGGGSGVAGAAGENNNNHHHQHQKETGLQPILFQNLETSRKEVSSGGGSSDGGGGGGGVGGLATEWFFDNHYAPVNMNPASTGNEQNGNNIDNWNGIQGWNHMNHYNALP